MTARTRQGSRWGERRRVRAKEADERLSTLWAVAHRELALPAGGAALVAVGGYGRAELSPGSDLDVVLLADDGYDERALADLAARLWYPLWDAHVRVDHAVRTTSELRSAVRDDLRCALGALDLRPVAGDTTLTLGVRSTLLADWRRGAKRRLPELVESTRERWARVGDVVHPTTPDLKEARGGLRDISVLRAMVASWLVDVPAAELARLASGVLEIRDALHETTGRHTDRLVAEYAEDVAGRLGTGGASELRQQLQEVGRGIGHLTAVAMRTVDWLAAPTRTRSRRPVLDVVAPGLGAYRGELVLTEKAHPARDPLLGLRAAEAAATRGLLLTDAAAARLGNELAPMPVPWPAEARALFGRLLGAGAGLVDVWDALDIYGVVDMLLPEWKRVRHLAPQSPVHRFTVDRHLVQTCVEAAPFIRQLDRADLLVVAALLHDIGKGGGEDHSDVGAGIAVDITARMGFAPREVDVIARLVRHHLLLVETATSSDLDDPRSVARVAGLVRDVSTLDLLAALTEADALATGSQAWSSWRKQLIATLVDATRRQLQLTPVQAPEMVASPVIRRHPSQ